MNINNTNYNSPTQTSYTNPQATESAENTQSATPTTPPTNNTPVAGSSGQNSVTFQTNAEHRAQNTMFLLERMFGDQAGMSSRASERSSSPFAAGSIAEYLSTLTPEQAADYVSEDGFWGVERTAQRLFDMAYSLSGGNPEELERMRDAVVRGFEAAERAWGSDLPQISHDTLDRTMQLFDEFFSR